MEWEVGGKLKREGTYVYLRLIHVDIWQQPTQYCKATILQLKKKKVTGSGGDQTAQRWNIYVAGGQGVQDCAKVDQRVRINKVEGPHIIMDSMGHWLWKSHQAHLGCFCPGRPFSIKLVQKRHQDMEHWDLSQHLKVLTPQEQTDSLVINLR